MKLVFKKFCDNFRQFLVRNKIIVSFSVILLVLGIVLIPKAFAEPVKNINISSDSLNFEDKDPGAWKVDKSAKWTGKGEAEITFDVDTIMKSNNKYADVLFVLDVSGSMNGDKLNRVKFDSIELIESLLSNGENKAGLITFDSTSNIVLDFTKDEELLVKKVNSLTPAGSTNYYQALVNVDEVLKNYKKEKDRDCIVLFLTDGYPNEDTPNEETQYSYLRQQYPFVTINGIQYEMGTNVLEPVKKVTDNQFIAYMDTLNNVLFDASVTPITYDEFLITDYIDTNYFYVNDEKDVKFNQGMINFDKENQKITWTINGYKSGSSAKMKIKVKLKAELINENGLYTTNIKEEIKSKIGEKEENVESNKTPVLSDNYKVIYDGNAPKGCNVEGVPETKKHSVFEVVEISDASLKCEGYQFRGWEIVNDSLRINDEYFTMPEEDVVIRAKWAKLSINKAMDGEVHNYEPATLEIYNSLSGDRRKGLHKYESSLTKIVFQNKMIQLVDAIDILDISSEDNGGILAYIVPNEDDRSKYTAYIQSYGKIMANSDSSYLFYNFRNLQSIENLAYLDTSNVTNMVNMFSGCSSLTSLDISNLETSNVTNMGGMFSGCSSLTSLDVSNFNTSNVINMSSMFLSCVSLPNVNLSDFDTSNVTKMDAMFYNCSSLVSLDLTDFDTSSVIDMTEMFFACSSLVSLDLSNFNTSKVTSMYTMFDCCSSLRSLNLSSFDTSNVINMSYMFSYCSSLTSLNLSSFYTLSVINMSSMFSNCRSLVSLDMSNFDTSEVTNMSYMFSGCSKLSTTITIVNILSDYNDMFDGAATEVGAQIIVDYTLETADVIDDYIATKSDNSNVVKKQYPEYTIIVIGNDDIVVDSSTAYAGKTVKLNSTSGMYAVKSFKMNGTLIKSDKFRMPAENVSITDIVVVDIVIIESEHNPYPNSLNNKIYGEKTYVDATSLNVELDYQTESSSYDWIYLYDSTGKQYGKYGGTTRKTETIMLPGDYVKVVFRTDSSGNNYYGFRAKITPNYN